MSSDMTGASRANRNGHLCPPWCVTHHGELQVPWDPSFGYQLAHMSDPMRAGQASIRLLQAGAPDCEAEVLIDMPSAWPRLGVSLSVSPRQAGQLAALLEAAPGQPGLTAQVRAAAELALEAGR